jgi:excisionase family DNA binding protein
MEEYLKNLMRSVLQEQQSLSSAKKDKVAITNSLYTNEEVCKILKISKSTLKRLRDRGHLVPSCYVGRSPRYSKEELEDYIHRNNCCD